MTIVDELTPTQYEVLRIALEPQGGTLVAMADFQVRNAAGRVVGTDYPAATLPPALLAELVTWYNERCAAYEAATGLTRYTP